MRRSCIAVLAALGLGACTTFDGAQQVARSNSALGDFTQGQLALARSDEDLLRRRQAAADLLARPLGQAEAVRLALLGSPQLQALLARHTAEGASLAQGGRLPNPMLSLERLRSGDELEIGRSLSFGLLELLMLPARAQLAGQRLAEQQIRLSADVVEQVTLVRQAWVRAVAARQLSQYAEQVYDSAGVSAELARRMQQAGNFNRLTRAREQGFYADAAARAANTRHQAIAAREALVRLLGLDDAQAARMQLPERLPDLPTHALGPEAVSQRARERLDLQLARAQFQGAARAQGLGQVQSLTDIELSVIRNTNFEGGGRSTARGAEIGLRLPLWDTGALRREALNARSLAAAQQLEATVRAAGSHLRESYSAYRTAHDIARHYRDEVVPLRKTIAEENLLRYNAMLIGVFELLADARDQVSTVMAAISAEEQFWLAEAALQSGLIGKPVGVQLSGPAPSSAPAPAGH